MLKHQYKKKPPSTVEQNGNATLATSNPSDVLDRALSHKPPIEPHNHSYNHSQQQGTRRQLNTFDNISARASSLGGSGGEKDTSVFLSNRIFTELGHDYTTTNYFYNEAIDAFAPISSLRPSATSSSLHPATLSVSLAGLDVIPQAPQHNAYNFDHLNLSYGVPGDQKQSSTRIFVPKFSTKTSVYRTSQPYATPPNGNSYQCGLTCLNTRLKLCLFIAAAILAVLLAMFALSLLIVYAISKYIYT